MGRFSIRALMGFIVASAVAVAALRNADDYWASGMILATPMLFGVALIGALCGEERARARRLGFAILGGGYFALAFMGLSQPGADRLPTSYLLSYIHQQVVPPLTVNAQPGPVSVVTSSPATLVSTTGRWKRLLPGAANWEDFSIVGHSLFALLAGLLGAVAGVWFRGRRERAET